MDEEDAPPKKKSGSARTSKKSKRRNVIRYEHWSAEQESVISSPAGVQQQAQDVDDGAPASLESTGEATTPVALETTPEAFMERSPDTCGTASGFLSPYDDQDVDAPPPDVHSPTTSEHTEELYEVQQTQEEQKADESPSENMRPTAQNLRYGGYPAQPAPQNRNTPLGSGRLQNTSKLGAIAFLESRICIMGC